MEQKTDKLKAFYGQIANRYNQLTNSPQAQWKAPAVINELLEDILLPAHNVLDLGVGTGQSIALAHQIGASVTGIDVSPHMISIAEQDYPNGKFLVGDITQPWPLQDQYDVIISCGALEFIPDLKPILRQVVAHSKHNAYLCFTYEYLDKTDPIQQYPISRIDNGLPTEPRSETSFLIYRRTHEEIETLLASNDYKIVKHRRFTAYNRHKGKYPAGYEAILAQLST